MGRLLARWVAWIARHALPVLLVVIVSTVGIGVYTANNLGVNADLDDMFAPDVPFRAREAEYERAFPLVGRDVVIVVDAGTPEQARDAARALATRMRAEPALFKSVFEELARLMDDGEYEVVGHEERTEMIGGQPDGAVTGHA